MKTSRLLLSVGLILGVVCLAADLGVSMAAEGDKRYVTTTLRGKLTDPESDKPLAGAILRFVSTQEDFSREVTTDDKGRFVVEGLIYSTYQIDIETAEGEKIRGVNALPIGDDKTVEVTLKISDRVRSETKLDNEPDRFVSAVEVKRVRWKRFWKEFGVFWGAAVVAGAATD